jgi:hypothetical protein
MKHLAEEAKHLIAPWPFQGSRSACHNPSIDHHRQRRRQS